jgi:E3 ubiquitin-protein ligase ZNF598
LQDKEDDTIFYEDSKAKAAGMQLRSLQCLMYNCPSTQNFPNVESLRRHMETQHQKTFCKICLAGRTVFIREQRIYHVKALRNHIDHGDPGTDKGAEILPHPWCDFCEQYFFNDQIFLDHLQRNHLTCHLCDDHYKNFYYNDYLSLETHFNKSHFLCPYDECKGKCYVAF